MDWQEFMAETEANIATLSKEMPETVKGFGATRRAPKTNGAMSEKTKEFMALGIAIATRCDSCIGFHAQSLVRLGATRDEFCEALAIATYMGGGPSLAFSAKALKVYDVYSDQAPAG